MALYMGFGWVKKKPTSRGYLTPFITGRGPSCTLHKTKSLPLQIHGWKFMAFNFGELGLLSGVNSLFVLGNFGYDSGVRMIRTQHMDYRSP